MIYNPRAGKIIRSGGLIERAHKTLLHHGHNVTMAPTTGPHTVPTPPNIVTINACAEVERPKAAETLAAR